MFLKRLNFCHDHLKNQAREMFLFNYDFTFIYIVTFIKKFIFG